MSIRKSSAEKATGEKRRRLLKKRWILPILLGVAVLSMYSPLVERPLAKQLIVWAREAGFQLEIGKLDVDPMRLAVRFSDVSLSGPGIDATVETAEVNCGMGLLVGRWSLDRVSLDSGDVQLGDLSQLFEGAPEGSGTGVPEIHLGRADVSHVSVTYRDHTQEIDGSLRDLHSSFRKPELTLGFVLRDVRAAGRQVDRAECSLRARTETFREFSDIDVQVETPFSRLSATGALSEEFRPFLRLDGVFGKDLTGLPQPLHVTGGLDDRQIECRLAMPITFRDQSLDVEAQTSFIWGPELSVPIVVRLGELAHGTLDAVYSRGSLDGSFRVQGKSEVGSLVPEIRVNGIDVNGRFFLPNGDLERLEVDWSCLIDGEPFVEGHGAARGRKADFWFRLFAQDEVRGEVRGAYDQNLQISFLFEGPDDRAAARWVTMDAGLAWGAWSLSGALEWTGETLVFYDTQASFEAVSLSPLQPQSMTLTCSGDWRRLQGDLQIQQGGGGSAQWEFNLPDLIVDSACVDLDQEVPAGDGPPHQIEVTAELQGPVAALTYSGKAVVSLSDAMLPGGALGWCSFSQEGDWLRLADFQAFWESLDVSGGGRLMTDLSRWDVDLIVRSEAVETAEATTIPEFSLNVFSNERHLGAALSLPNQEIRHGTQTISVGSRGPVEMEVALDAIDRVELGGGFWIAGIKLSELQLGVSGDRFEASLNVDLVDPTELRRAIRDAWPDGLELQEFSAHLSASTERDFSCPQMQGQATLSGAFQDYPFATSRLSFGYDDGWSIDPFDGVFAGVAYRCMTQDITQRPIYQTLERFSQFEGEPDLTVFCEFDVFDSPSVLALAGLEGSAGLERLNGVAIASFSSSFSKIGVGVGIAELNAQVNTVSLQTHDLAVAYDGAWRVSPGILQVGGWPLDLSQTDGGFQLSGMIGMMHLRPFMDDLLGDAWFDMNLEVFEAGQDMDARLVLKQRQGTLILPDPWIEVTQLEASIRLDRQGKFVIEEGRAKVNSGAVLLEGGGELGGEQLVLDLDLLGYDVPVELADVAATWTFSLRYTNRDGQQQIKGAVLCRDGYYGPRGGLERIVRDLLAEVPAVYFPDPFLSAVELQVNVQTQSPLIVDQKEAYLELESPSILVRGTLDEPSLNSGSLFIAEGSELSIGNETIVFQASQIQFHPNRPDEPYLQIYMEYGDFGDRKPLQILGYLSDLEQNIGSGEMATFLANFLLGRVSSLVSVESETNETVFDTSFTVVLSQSLTRKIVTRYAVPLNRQTEQRFELGFGPYAGNLLNLIYSQNETTVDWRHQQKFGLPAGIPEKIKKIAWEMPEDWSATEWAKEFKMKRGEPFSETRLRRAVVSLDRLLAQSGYLSPNIETRFEEKVLTVHVDPGPRTRIEIQGLDVPEVDRRDMLRVIKNGGTNPGQRLRAWMNAYLMETGYRDAKVSLTQLGDIYRISVSGLVPLGPVRLDLDEAGMWLKSSINTPKAERQLVQDYLLSPGATQAELRARLAAYGFVNPRLSNGFFVMDDLFWIPVNLGPRAQVTRVTVNPNELVDDRFLAEFVGQIFGYELLQRMSQKLSSVLTGTGRAVLTPIREGTDVAVSVDVLRFEVPQVDSLQVQGNRRIPEEKIISFLGFEPGMTQTEFNKAQERLISAGPFRAARLFGSGGASLLELEERNRWDLDYGLALNEREELTLVGQFKDRMFFKGINDLVVRAEEGQYERQIAVQTVFRRVFGSPLDFFSRASWDETSRDDNPEDLPSLRYLGALERRLSFPENQRIVFEFSYPFLSHQELRLGWEFWRIINHDVIKYHDDYDVEDGGELDESLVFEEESSQTEVDLSPLKLTWVYRHLDHKTDPRNGGLASLSMEYFLDALGSSDQANGIRLSGSQTYFHTWGPVMWSHRLKAGWYKPKIPLETVPSEQDPVVFYLGGPTTLRGYEHNRAGVYSVSDEAWVGGEAMFFWSEELTYMTPWFGLGVTPFVDSGRVWPQIDDIRFSDLLVSAGLGLSWDSPLGYLRLDWVTRVKEDIGDEVASDPREDWHFRFGRTF